jgi:hypothetical protein
MDVVLQFALEGKLPDLKEETPDALGVPLTETVQPVVTHQ